MRYKQMRMISSMPLVFEKEKEDMHYADPYAEDKRKLYKITI